MIRPGMNVNKPAMTSAQEKAQHRATMSLDLVLVCSPVGLGSHLGRLRSEDVCHRTRFAELLVQSLAVAARKGVG
jgi:hypothetical protein